MNNPVTRAIRKAELDRFLVRQSAAWTATLALAVTPSKVFA